MMLVSFNISTMCVTYGAGIATLPEHPSSSPLFSGIRVARSLVFCVLLNRSLFVLFLFGHYIVCSSIYGFWLPLWYLQTLLFVNGFLVLLKMFDFHCRNAIDDFENPISHEINEISLMVIQLTLVEQSIDWSLWAMWVFEIVNGSSAKEFEYFSAIYTFRLPSVQSSAAW